MSHYPSIFKPYYVFLVQYEYLFRIEGRNKKNKRSKVKNICLKYNNLWLDKYLITLSMYSVFTLNLINFAK